MAKGRRRRNEDSGPSALEHLNGAEGQNDMEGAGVAVHLDPPLNSSARAEIIREAIATINDFEKQIDGLKSEIKAVIDTRIVAGLGMKKRDFALARKVLAIDYDERNKLQDTIRECFAALGVGQQMNWLDAAAEAGDEAH